MPTLSKAQITGIVSLVMVLTSVIVVDNISSTYYCESEDNVKECFRVSSSGLTCYYLLAEDLTKGDRCTGGLWEPLVMPVEVPVEPERPSLAIEIKSYPGDDCIIKGEWCYCNPRGSLDNKRKC